MENPNILHRFTISRRALHLKGRVRKEEQIESGVRGVWRERERGNEIMGMREEEGRKEKKGREDEYAVSTERVCVALPKRPLR